MEQHVIAARAAEQLDELKAAINKARQGDLPEIDAQFSRIIERLGDASATISVVGQVKAGKSSLINALAGIGDLLPTEVNPWTAVITNLHFGSEGRQDGSAEFQLFSEAEWGRMLGGGSDARRLAEELLPGFKSDVLDRQIREMQIKAQRRLGDLYHFLLGKQHKFNMVTPEILERYVSAGYSDDDMSKSTAGKFSCITKSADVYLAPGPCKIPLTLSDTPGINDPFLVRDEITTNSLTKADIFVVALSAHQTMNAADIGLLKMLGHHPTKPTIVYVNRIDELDDTSVSVMMVLNNLEKRMAEEVGATNQTIVAGSAEWGRIAVNGSDDEVEQAMASGAVERYLKARRLKSGPTPREKLFTASGLEMLTEKLSDFIADGRVRDVQEAAAAETFASMNVLDRVLTERLNQAGSLVATDNIEMISQDELRRINDRINLLTSLAQSLTGVSDEGVQRLMDNAQIVITTVVGAIKTAIDRFIDDQIQRYRRDRQMKAKMATWKFDTGEIESRVQGQVSDSFRIGREEMDQLLLAYAQRLNEAIKPIADGLKMNRLLSNLPNDDVLVGFKPRQNLINVVMTTNRGWKFWRSKHLDEDEAIDRIIRVIRADLYPMMHNIQEMVQRAIAERNSVAIERLTGQLGSAQEMIRSEIAMLQDDANELGSDLGRDKAAAIFEERRRRNDALRARIDEVRAARQFLRDRYPSVASDGDVSVGRLKGNANI